jgi:uncharacterized protein YjbI with pentapeptide repeats
MCLKTIQADLEGADVSGSKWEGADMTNCKMGKISFEGTYQL